MVGFCAKISDINSSKEGLFMIKASIITLGCRVNQYESDAIMQELSNNGISICNSDEVCDIYIINTCSVTAQSDKKSRQLIRRCIAKNKNAVIIVTGCFSQINPEAALSIEGVDLVCGNNGKSSIAKRAIELYYERKAPHMYMPNIYDSSFDTMLVGAPLTRTRAFIKIQDGCDSKCAYCIIPFARGSVRSNPAVNVINEVKNIVSQGCCEVVLTGIETASYGKDFKNGYGLTDLLREINEIKGLKRIRLGSLDPVSINKDFVDTVKELNKVMPHFHISMQSGCSRILALMKRKYSIDMAKKNLDYLRECIPCVKLSCDVIVGFPSESDEDFEQTRQFFLNEEFLHMHIFPYSKREGTVASTMPNQVPENKKKERLYALQEVETISKRRIFEGILSSDSEVEVLFETLENGYACGHTRDFIEVKVKSDIDLGGKILNVKPASFDENYIYGTIKG